MTFAEVRYQRRERGDQGQQGAEDWPDAQGRQCMISPRLLSCHTFDSVMYHRY